jgi:hypothetical protein
MMYEEEPIYAILRTVLWSESGSNAVQSKSTPFDEVVTSLRKYRPLTEISSNIYNQVQGLAFEGDTGRGLKQLISHWNQSLAG